MSIAWRTTPPTEPGHYWLKARDKVVELDFNQDGELALVLCGGRIMRIPDGSVFAGPLPHPDTAPTWTRDLPTREGAYWARWKPGSAFTLQVVTYEHDGELFAAGLGPIADRGAKLEWFGPLEDAPP